MSVIAQLLGSVEVGPAEVCRNLAMFPLRSETLAEPDYLILDEALAAHTAHVTEVSAGGSVPELRFANEGRTAVFLMDGEEVVGAKQNRVLNLSILAPAGKTIVIPVSCVEMGRWSHVSPEFATSSHAHYARGRASKLEQVSNSLAFDGARRSDQGEVWAGIAAKAARMEAPSPTSAMSAVFERHATSVEEFVGALRPTDGQAGALFAIDGAVVGLDLFDCPTTLAKLLPKLVRSYALDAIETSGRPRDGASVEQARAFVTSLAEAQARAYPAVGEGEDVRLAGAGVVGGALVARGRAVHLSAFAAADGHEAAVGVGRMSSASQRRSARMA